MRKLRSFSRPPLPFLGWFPRQRSIRAWPEQAPAVSSGRPPRPQSQASLGYTSRRQAPSLPCSISSPFSLPEAFRAQVSVAETKLWHARSAARPKVCPYRPIRYRRSRHPVGCCTPTCRAVRAPSIFVSAVWRLTGVCIRTMPPAPFFVTRCPVMTVCVDVVAFGDRYWGFNASNCFCMKLELRSAPSSKVSGSVCGETISKHNDVLSEI